MEQKKRKQQGFLEGSFILVFATVAVKLIGALFRIPLGSLLGETGMGYFSTAYDLYLPIYSLAMAGLPVAISKIVAEYITKHKYSDVRKTLIISRRTFWITGIAGFVVMMIAAYPFAKFTLNTGSLFGIFAIAPSILFCCIMSAYRGYYEGLRNMYPTAISSVIEALGKLILGYGFAWLVIQYFGEVTPTSLSYAAGAALMGISIGSLAGSIYLSAKYHFGKDNFTAEELVASGDPLSGKDTFNNLIRIAIPVMLSSLANTIGNLIDVAMVQRQLAGIVQDHPGVLSEIYAELINLRGLQESEIPNALYGSYKGYAFSVFNLVPTITSVLGVSALPVLTTSWTNGDKAAVKTDVELMLKTTSIICVPCGIGLMFMAKPVLQFLYPTQTVGVDIAAPMLAILGISAIFSGLMGPLNNMLQAVGRQDIPVKNMAVAATLKIVVNYILVQIPSINIMGAPIGTVVSHVYMAVGNYVCLVYFSKVKPSLLKIFIKPLIASLFCGGAARLCYVFLAEKLVSGRIATVISLVIAVFVYAIALICVRGIDKNDLKSMPMGEKLIKTLEKIKIIK